MIKTLSLSNQLFVVCEVFLQTDLLTPSSLLHSAQSLGHTLCQQGAKSDVGYLCQRGEAGQVRL